MNNNITIDKAVGIIYQIPDSATMEVTGVNGYRLLTHVLNSPTDWTRKCSGSPISLLTLNEERIILFNPYTTVSSESTFSKLFPFNLTS